MRELSPAEMIEGGQSLGVLVALVAAIGIPFLMLMVGLRGLMGIFGI